MEFLRRRKRLIVGFAAGAAGAAAAYYWWMGYHKTKLQQQRSVEMELTAILRGAALHHGNGGASGDSANDGDATDADDCGSPDLDESLDSHFNYIQKVSAPQELSNLLPRIQATLFRQTDVSLVKQLHQSAGGGSGGVQQQLRLLARLCFGRTVAAAFLLPLMDLCVRTKLNIIGRHLFLQEKFSKLRQPAAPAARMRLPPRLTAAAVETFLACEQLAERGCAWLADQAMAAADLVLEGTPMDTNVTPEELAEMVQAMATCLGQTVTAAGATSPTGCAWVDTIVGPTALPAVGVDAAATSGSAEAYRRALTNAAMVEELESELRRVLCNYRFGEALLAAVSQCLNTCAAHIHATFISQAAAAVQQHQHSPQPVQPAPEEEDQPPAGQTTTPMQPQGPVPSEETLPQSPSHPAQQQKNGDQAESPCAEAWPPSCMIACKEVEEGSLWEGQQNEQQVRKDGEAGPETADAQHQVAVGAAAPVTTEAPGATLVPAATMPMRSGSSGGGASRTASLAAAAVAAMQPRPLARCLRAVQGACEPLFVDAREVSARIACLQPVMSLCAVAFAAPLEL